MVFFGRTFFDSNIMCTDIHLDLDVKFTCSICLYRKYQIEDIVLVVNIALVAFLITMDSMISLKELFCPLT